MNPNDTVLWHQASVLATNCLWTTGGSRRTPIAKKTCFFPKKDGKLQYTITFKRLELETWRFERWKALQFWEKMSPRKPKKLPPGPGLGRGSRIHTGPATFRRFLRFGLCRWTCLFCNFWPFLRPYFFAKIPSFETCKNHVKFDKIKFFQKLLKKSPKNVSIFFRIFFKQFFWKMFIKIFKKCLHFFHILFKM